MDTKTTTGKTASQALQEVIREMMILRLSNCLGSEPDYDDSVRMQHARSSLNDALSHGDVHPETLARISAHILDQNILSSFGVDTLSRVEVQSGKDCIRFTYMNKRDVHQLFEDASVDATTEAPDLCQSRCVTISTSPETMCDLPQYLTAAVFSSVLDRDQHEKLRLHSLKIHKAAQDIETSAAVDVIVWAQLASLMDPGQRDLYTAAPSVMVAQNSLKAMIDQKRLNPEGVALNTYQAFCRNVLDGLNIIDHDARHSIRDDHGQVSLQYEVPAGWSSVGAPQKWEGRAEHIKTQNDSAGKIVGNVVTTMYTRVLSHDQRNHLWIRRKEVLQNVNLGSMNTDTSVDHVDHVDEPSYTL